MVDNRMAGDGVRPVFGGCTDGYGKNAEVRAGFKSAPVMEFSGFKIIRETGVDHFVDRPVP